MKDFLSLNCSIERTCHPISCEQIMTSVPAGNHPAFDNMVHLSTFNQKTTPHRYQQSPVFKRKTAHNNKHSSRYSHSHSHPTRSETHEQLSHHHNHQHRHKSADEAKTSDAADAKVHLLSSLPWKSNHTAVSEPNLDIAMKLADHHPQRFHGSVMIVQESLINHEHHKTLPSSPRHRHRRHTKSTSDCTDEKPAHCEAIFCFDEEDFTLPLPMNTEQTATTTTVFSPIDTPTTPLIENFFDPEDQMNNNIPVFAEKAVSFPNSPSTETLKNYEDIEFTTHDLGFGLLRRRSSDASISSTDTVT